MATNLYGVTVESVRKHHFPNADAWTESSRPCESVVSEAIDEEAGVLAGKLNLETIDASAIEAASPAFTSCRKQLRMMVALRIAQDMTGVEPAIVVAWKKSVKEWFDGLEEGGTTFLGGGATATSTSEPDGPTDFISEHSLDVGEEADISDVVPPLRRSDQL